MIHKWSTQFRNLFKIQGVQCQEKPVRWFNNNGTLTGVQQRIQRRRRHRICRQHRTGRTFPRRRDIWRMERKPWCRLLKTKVSKFVAVLEFWTWMASLELRKALALESLIFSLAAADAAGDAASDGESGAASATDLLTIQGRGGDGGNEGGDDL